MLLSSLYWDDSVTTHARKQLIGIKPYWNTIVSLHDLRQLLTESELAYYERIKNVLSRVEQKQFPESRAFREAKRDLSPQKNIPNCENIAQLLLCDIAFTVYNMPIRDDNYKFRSGNVNTLNAINPDVGIPLQQDTQIEYIHTMLRKLEGQETLFIHVRFIGDTRSIFFR